MEPLSISKSSI